MMRTKYWVIASTGRVMSEPYYVRADAQAYADSLAVDFAEDGTAFWVVDCI